LSAVPCQRFRKANVVSNEEIGNDLRWKKLLVGNGGSVCLVDWMGDDYAIAEAARVSYGEGTRSVNTERGLIRYLMRHWHTTPFEMAELKFRIKVPMDTWRQWIRHRTANINEYSTRYSVAIDECAKTLPGKWRLQATDKRIGTPPPISKNLRGAPGVRSG
jgi:thymidylate synthase (FAD)